MKNKPQTFIDISQKWDTVYSRLQKKIRDNVSWIDWLDIVFLSHTVDHTQTLQVWCKQTGWLVIQIILSKCEVDAILCTSLKSDWTCKSNSWRNCKIKWENNKIENPIKD